MWIVYVCIHFILLIHITCCCQKDRISFFSDKCLSCIEHVTRFTSNVSLLILAFFVKKTALFDQNVNKNNNKPDSTQIITLVLVNCDCKCCTQKIIKNVTHYIKILIFVIKTEQFGLRIRGLEDLRIIGSKNLRIREWRKILTKEIQKSPSHFLTTGCLRTMW